MSGEPKFSSCEHMSEGQEGWCLQCAAEIGNALNVCVEKLRAGERGLPGYWLVMLQLGSYEDGSNVYLPLGYRSEDLEAEPDATALLEKFGEDFAAAATRHELISDGEPPCECCGRGGSRGTTACELLLELFGRTADQTLHIYAAMEDMGPNWEARTPNIFDVSRVVYLPNVDRYLAEKESGEDEEGAEYHAGAAWIERPRKQSAEEW